MGETLASKFIAQAKQFPDEIVMQIKTKNGYVKYSYQDIYKKAIAIAQMLQKKYKVKPGDRVAIVMENKPEWGMTYFGIMIADAIAVPIDPQSPQKDLEYFLKHSGSKVVFNPHPHPLPPLPGPLPKGEGVAEDVASILYTSGTTGIPKGVMLTHENFLANYNSLTKLNLIDRKHNVLSLLPLHHAFPFMVNLIVPLFSRSMITYISDLSSESILSCMRETGVTALIGVPQLYYMLYNNIKNQLQKVSWLVRTLFKPIIAAKIRKVFGKQLQFFVCGGAKLDVEVARFFTKLGFTFLEGYGLTETSPVVTFNLKKDLRIGSVGKPIPDVSVKIINPNEQGIGEVTISGTNVMPGYYKLPKETKEVLKESWFYSGDLGYLDKAGFLYIVGRTKELIVLSSGKNIAPDEVEGYYATNPFIKEICVLAVGGRGEDKLMAVIVPDLDHFRKVGEVNIYEALKWHLENLSQHYPAYKRIMGFVVAKDELPRTRLGKLKRYAIKEIYKDELLGKGEAKIAKASLTDAELQIMTTDTAQQIIKILQKQLNQKIHLTDHLEMDLGLDSLSRVELMANLGQVLQIAIPENIATESFTVKELIVSIEKLSKKPAKAKVQAVSWAEILTNKPPMAITNKIELSPNWFTTFCFLILTLVGKAIFKIFWRLKVVGKENLPQDKPFIVCPNHNSYLDPLAVTAVAPSWLRKKMFFLGYSNYFEAPILRNFVKLLNVIPIDPALHLVDAMQAAAYVLRHKKVICIFPEGARSIDGEVKIFKKGIGILAQELNLDIVPVYIEGAFEAWPRGKRFPKPHPIKVIFGKPCNITDLKKAGGKLGAKDDYEAITLAIREEVVSLKIVSQN